MYVCTYISICMYVYVYKCMCLYVYTYEVSVLNDKFVDIARIHACIYLLKYSLELVDLVSMFLGNFESVSRHRVKPSASVCLSIYIYIYIYIYMWVYLHINKVSSWSNDKILFSESTKTRNHKSDCVKSGAQELDHTHKPLKEASGTIILVCILCLNSRLKTHWWWPICVWRHAKKNPQIKNEVNDGVSPTPLSRLCNVQKSRLCPSSNAPWICGWENSNGNWFENCADGSSCVHIHKHFVRHT